MGQDNRLDGWVAGELWNTGRCPACVASVSCREFMRRYSDSEFEDNRSRAVTPQGMLVPIGVGVVCAQCQNVVWGEVKTT